MSTEDSDPTFPFVGAGEAEYFEWAEVFVCFSRAPDAAERAAIGADVPLPLRDTIDWKGTLLWVASEQGVGRLIKAAYARPPGKPSTLTTQSRFAMAPVRADAAFNADIDRWLREAHRRVPVLVAFRREDAEAGGTAVSAWHHASVARLPEILTALASPPHRSAGAALGGKLTAVATSAGLSVPEELRATFDRARAEAKAEKDAAREAHDEACRVAVVAALTEQSLAPQTAVDPARLDPAIDALLPRFAKRLRRAVDHALRPGADAAAIAGVEQALGLPLSAEHRALLAAFDGGRVARIQFLGTETGGSRGEDAIATFTRAWTGEGAIEHVLLARTGRDRVLGFTGGRRTDAGKKGETYLFECEPGFGGGRVVRLFKTLDGALDAILKAGEV